MQDFLEFIFLLNSSVRNVLFGIVLMCVCAAIVGCFTFLRKRSLLGDAVAHSTLPGVCMGFVLAGSKNPYYILVGAFVTGFISTYFIDYITRHSKIKADTALAIVLTLFFGIGILMLTAIQHSGNAAQSGLDSFLFGKVAALLSEDLWVFGSTALVVILVTIYFFKEFSIISFDALFARSIGMPVKKLELLLTVITVLTIVIGIQAVGVILMASLLITPAATARFWTDSLPKMIFISIALSVASGVGGAYLSYHIPNLPTGPSIVMLLSSMAMISFALAPKKGVLSRYILQIKNRNKILEENILKAMYQLGERNKNYNALLASEDIVAKREFDHQKLKTGLRKLKNRGYVTFEHTQWKLTTEGRKKGQRITRLHRLWEMYLTQYLHLSPDHVHDDAETIEHIITPEIEAKLSEILGYPKVDPHQMEIPYNE